MLHKTIVLFFNYLKENYLLHLDTANRNIYFNNGRLVIIDFGESYILPTRVIVDNEKYIKVRPILDKKSLSNNEQLLYKYQDNPEGIYLSENIFYLRPAPQRDGYPVSNNHKLKEDYDTNKLEIKKWLYGIEECRKIDNLPLEIVPRYGGLKKKKLRRLT
jgi:hypothetical protein